jgi:AcrR family transcriptional regulator
MQKRASRTRLIILHAAAETFGTRGYAATSLQNIASHMGVSKGTLYFHFPSKKEIALAVIREYHDQLPEILSQLRQQHSRAIRLLLELSQEIADMADKSVMMRAAIRLIHEHDLIGSTAPQPFSGWINIIDGLLKETRAQGDLLPDVEIESAARVIVASFAGYQQLTELRERSRDARKCVYTMWRYLLPGLVNSGCIAELQTLFTNGDD